MVMPSGRGGFFFGLAWTAVFSLFGWKLRCRSNEVHLSVGLWFWLVLRARPLPVPWRPDCSKHSAKLPAHAKWRCKAVFSFHASLLWEAPAVILPSPPLWGWPGGRGRQPARAPRLLSPGRAIRAPESLRSAWKFGLKFRSVLPTVN